MGLDASHSENNFELQKPQPVSISITQLAHPFSQLTINAIVETDDLYAGKFIITQASRSQEYPLPMLWILELLTNEFTGYVDEELVIMPGSYSISIQTGVNRFEVVYRDGDFDVIVQYKRDEAGVFNQVPYKDQELSFFISNFLQHIFDNEFSDPLDAHLYQYLTTENEKGELNEFYRDDVTLSSLRNWAWTVSRVDLRDKNIDRMVLAELLSDYVIYTLRTIVLKDYYYALNEIKFITIKKSIREFTKILVFKKIDLANIDDFSKLGADIYNMINNLQSSGYIPDYYFGDPKTTLTLLLGGYEDLYYDLFKLIIHTWNYMVFTYYNPSQNDEGDNSQGELSPF